MNHRTTAACGPPEACWIDLARVPHAPLFKPRRPVDSWKIIPRAIDEHDITIATFVRTVRDLTGAIAGGTLEPEHVDWREFHAAADRLFELITD